MVDASLFVYLSLSRSSTSLSSLVQRAIDGNVRAAKLIFDLMADDNTHALDEREDDPITAALNEEFGEGAF